VLQDAWERHIAEMAGLGTAFSPTLTPESDAVQLALDEKHWIHVK